MFHLQVLSLETSLDVLLKTGQKTSAARIAWPSSVCATTNLSHCDGGSLKFAAQGRLRKAEYLAIFPDCFIVAVSCREAEYLLRAARRLMSEGRSMSVAVTHIAFMRWLHPVTLCDPSGSSQQDHFNAALPWHAYGASLQFRLHGEHQQVARNVVALQVFNGDTEYEHQDASPSTDTGPETARDEERKNVVGSWLFEQSMSKRHANEIFAAVKQVVVARERAMYWEGSTLANICREGTARVQP